jgi:putative lipoic acid-binding regulatory protein
VVSESGGNGNGSDGQTSETESPLKFPTEYPIKVLGRPSDEFRARVHAIMLKHAPDLDPSRMTERLSEKGNFLSISYVIVAQSREQVTALATELAACELAMMVL